MYRQAIINLYLEQGFANIPTHIIDQIANDPEVIREILTNDFDTVTNELLLDKLPAAVGVSVRVADMIGKVEQSHWPHYGDPIEYREEWNHQIETILTVAGATVEFDDDSR